MCVLLQKLTDVSEEHTAYLFRVGPLLKCQEISSILHDVTSMMTAFFTVTAVRTSNIHHPEK